MEKNEAFEIYDALANREIRSQNPIEVKVRSGIQEMFGAMFRVYWQRCFEGKLQQQIPKPETKHEMEALTLLLRSFTNERACEWREILDKCHRFGRDEDAQKEEWKLDHLQILTRVFNELVGKKHGYRINI